MDWNRSSLVDRIRWLRIGLPPLLALWVVIYQLAFAQPLEAAYGHVVHYGVEIAFYSLVGPVATWLVLAWVERNVREKEQLEARIRRVAQEKAAVLEEERARIARDLHDGVAQNLYFMALKTDLLRGQVQSDARVTTELRELGQTARRVIREVRQTIFALHPLDWSQGAFLLALDEFVRGFAEQAGWQVSVAIDQDLAVPSTLEPVLFRLVQESLNNVAKHAEASQIELSLAAANGGHSLCLAVSDNGQGFDLQTTKRHGLGLRQMAARTEAAGGIFEVASSPGQGTTITATLPILDDDHE